METQTNQTNSISTDKESKIVTANNLPTQVEIQDWIVNYIAELLETKPDVIDVTIPFDRYGLDSAVAYELAGDLEIWLDRELDPTLIYNYPTIEALTQQLTEELKHKV